MLRSLVEHVLMISREALKMISCDEALTTIYREALTMISREVAMTKA